MLSTTLFHQQVTGAAWQLEDESQSGGVAQARVDNEDDESLQVHRAGDRVVLEFTANVPQGLIRSSCPTFQIDNRSPQHFFTSGADCQVDGATARYDVSVLVNDRTVSLVLYRLINGSRVYFRYLTPDGSYHQSVFSLSQSKQALLGALGGTIEVDPGVAE